MTPPAFNVMSLNLSIQAPSSRAPYLGLQLSFTFTFTNIPYLLSPTEPPFPPSTFRLPLSEFRFSLILIFILIRPDLVGPAPSITNA